MTYGKAISTLESETQETVEASVMLEAIDKILSMATIIAVNKNALMNAVRFLRNHVNELLKEQEAVEPKLVGVNTWTCGKCGALLGWEDFTQSGLELVKYKFCPECGKAVKWE